MLSPEQIAQFDRDGVIGPFRAVAPGVAASLCEEMKRTVLVRRSPIYADSRPSALLPEFLPYTRDRHLDSRPVYELATNEQILERVRSLLGDDVLLWRSDMFVKRPGDPATSWHQDKDFLGSAGIPTISCPDRQGLPRVITAWIAITPADENSSYLKYIPGSHRLDVIPERPATGRAIFGRGTELDLPASYFEQAEARAMPMDHGWFILHNELTLHSSSTPPNDTSERIALGVRFTSSENLLYPEGKSPHGLDLSRYGALLVSGVSRNPANRIVSPPATSSR